MSRLLAVIVLAVALIACSTKPQSPPAPTITATTDPSGYNTSAATGTAMISATGDSPHHQHGMASPELIDKLRKKAAAQNLHWFVYCSSGYSDEAESFGATADPPGSFGKFFIEDGAKPSWVIGQAPTQAAAVKQLIAALDGPPNFIPDHKPPERERRRCPRPLEGGAE